jgi:RNA polymerase sigma factor (sigma-70 family)
VFDTEREGRETSAKHCTQNGDAESVRFCADEEALARVLEAARGPAGAVAQRVVRNWHTAEDVVQEALLRAVVAQDRLQSKNNLEAWFLGVVRNIAVDRVRREVREREIMEALSAVGLSDAAIPRRDATELEQEELRDLIREAMGQLSDHWKRRMSPSAVSSMARARYGWIGWNSTWWITRFRAHACP